MRAEFIAGNLLSAVNVVSSVVENRTTIPILSCLIVEADRKSGARVFGTDLDCSISAPVPSACSAGFSVAVSALQLARILRSLPRLSTCAIESDKEGRVYLVFSGGRYRLISGNPKDMPRLDFGAAGARRYRLNADEFTSGLRRVSRCISTEQTRYYLNGVCLTLIAGALKIVATDGHRLAFAPAGFEVADSGQEIKDGSGKEFRPIIRRADCQRILSKRLAPAVVAFDAAGKVQFECAGGIVLTSKLIDASFPDIARVIPKPHDEDKKFTVDAPALLAALRRMRAANCVPGFGTRMSIFRFDPRGLLIAADNSDLKGTIEVVPMDFPPAAAFEIGLNTQYVIDLLSQIGAVSDGKIQFVCKDPASPVLIPGDGVTAVQMPARASSFQEVSGDPPEAEAAA